MKRLKKIPKFKDEEAEREFWSNADSTEYIDWSRAQKLVLPNIECDASEPNAIGMLRKISSISQSVTRCFGQFLPMFPVVAIASSQTYTAVNSDDHCAGAGFGPCRIDLA
ncbi:MAG TPA: CopG family antitoxin [Thermoanaerobaculia bacterium]